MSRRKRRDRSNVGKLEDIQHHLIGYYIEAIRIIHYERVC